MTTVTTTNLQKYGDFPVEEAEKELAIVERESTGGAYMKLQVGRNVVRILPNKTPGKMPFVRVKEHYIKVPGNDRAVVFACPTAMAKKRCPACEKADRLRQSGNPVDRDAAYELSAKMRIYANVIDRNEPESGPKILAFGKTIYERLMTLRKDEDAGGNYTDPVNGFDIIITRKGTGMDTSYEVDAHRKLTQLSANAMQAAEWIENQHDLEGRAAVRSYEELIKSLRGESAGGERGGSGLKGNYTPPAGKGAAKARTADDDMADAGTGVDDDDVSF